MRFWVSSCTGNSHIFQHAANTEASDTSRYSYWHTSFILKYWIILRRQFSELFIMASFEPTHTCMNNDPCAPRRGAMESWLHRLTPSHVRTGHRLSTKNDLNHYFTSQHHIMMSVPPQNTKTQLSQKSFTTTLRYMTRVTSSLKLRTLTDIMWHQLKVSNSSSSRDNVSSSPQKQCTTYKTNKRG